MMYRFSQMRKSADALEIVLDALVPTPDVQRFAQVPLIPRPGARDLRICASSQMFSGPSRMIERTERISCPYMSSMMQSAQR